MARLYKVIWGLNTARASWVSATQGPAASVGTHSAVWSFRPSWLIASVIQSRTGNELSAQLWQRWLVTLSQALSFYQTSIMFSSIKLRCNSKEKRLFSDLMDYHSTRLSVSLASGPTAGSSFCPQPFKAPPFPPFPKHSGYYLLSLLPGSRI